MSEKKATRVGFGEALLQLGHEDERVVVLSADLTSSVSATNFKKEFPNRFFSIGIAEQDLIGTAAGMAIAGKLPFVSTFSMFASGRCWEQIRNTVCYSNLDVKIGGSHSGITVGEDGATHQALEDISLIRCLPNMKIIVPCDAIETKKATLAVAKTPGPAYIRFGRANVSTLTTEDTPFEIGKANILKQGSHISIIACGIMVEQALIAAEILNNQDIDAEVINLHTIKPIDKEAILKSAYKTGAVVTAEEHQRHGGLGSAVAEVLVENCPVPVEMVGVQDKFGASGCATKLLKCYGLTKDEIVEAAIKVISRKKACSTI